ncbi:BAI1-associated protein 3-like isoform X3 [Portunus trituberculatus]|uniref:BAI1-associated protein 3-like isoform X3 n=1 Tax=Portunus trituberculatus TaxID=210409 RepID=UPI001E1D211E|nr:BAI1-associated protein 3-like isoform X3 [Portunus trituberculatus]
MSFLNSLQQVVAGVTSSVTNLSLSPKRFPFGRENSTGGSEVTTTTAPQHQSHHHRPGGSPNPRLGPKLVPTPGAVGGASPRPQGRCKSFMNHMMHPPPPMVQQPRPKKERERRPLPVLQCGDRYTFWPEYDPSQTWVSEVDGAWLEQFTSLGWRHSEALRTLKAQGRQGSRDTAPEILASLKKNEFRLSKSESESLYVEVLYTVFHKVGVQQHVGEDLTKYAQAAFHTEPHDHLRLQAVAQEEKPPILVLNLVVVEAENLEAKDPNGFSDPYCMLGIQPAVQSGLPGSPRDVYNLAQGSPPPDSPRNRHFSGGSRSSVEVEADSDGDKSSSCESPKSFAKESLRKHHSFRLSFKRRPAEPKREKLEHRDSLSNAIPAKIIRATSVKPHTLNPRWNEKFRLDIDDISLDILHLDIWDHDDESSVFEVVSKLNEVKGVKGLGRFFKQIAQSARQGGGQDDFLGCVNVPLQDIPSIGVDKWYPLEGRSHRSNIQGQINLKMWLSTREDRGRSEEEVWAEVREHDQIITIFLLHELNKFKENTVTWDGELSTAAQTILHQHAIQGDLTQLQQAMCRWMAVSRTHTSKPVDPRVLHRYLLALHDLWDTETLGKEEEEMLADSYTGFLEYTMTEVRRHREVFPMPSKTHAIRLEALLKCLSLLAESRSYWKVCPFHKEVRGEVMAALKRGAVEWYAQARLRYDRHREASLATGGDIALESLAKLALHLTLDLQAGVDYYDHAFSSTSLKIPYAAINYKIFEKLLSEDALKVLTVIQVDEDIENEIWQMCALLRDLELNKETPYYNPHCSTSPFLLYLALAEFSKFQEHVAASERRALLLGSVWGHFLPAVSRWVDVTAFRVFYRIRVAILTDRVANTGEPVQYTTSAVDTTSCFYHVKTFWRHLAWPDLSTSYSLVVRMVETMSGAADYYVHLLQQRLSTLATDTTDMERAQQLCITVNNMEHVRHSLTLLQEELQLDHLTQQLDAQDGQGGTTYADHIGSLLLEALTNLDAKIANSMSPVAEQIGVELQKDVFHLAWSPDSLPAEEAVRPLLERLFASLSTYSAALLKNNLDRLLYLLWLAVLGALHDQIGKDTEEKQVTFFVRLYDALELLRAFFSAHGRGLDDNSLAGPEYMTLERQLRLHKTTTETLIETYHMERLMEQERVESQEYGSLFVRAYFNHDSLCVEVLQARNVIPLDPNGFSDPFVVIELLPRRLFPGAAQQQTNVHKKTLHPLFDECFEFPASLESCQAEGAMILFTLMDHDVITCNDFGGEAFLSLNTISGVVASSSSVDNFHGLKPIELSLMFQKDPDNSILKVLETRTSDKVALEFVKKQKERIARPT